jgi:hypothetical protein
LLPFAAGASFTASKSGARSIRADCGPSLRLRVLWGHLAKAALQREIKSTNAANDLMAAKSPLYRMLSRSILQVQKNFPYVNGPKLTFATLSSAAAQLH